MMIGKSQQRFITVLVTCDFERNEAVYGLVDVQLCSLHFLALQKIQLLLFSISGDMAASLLPLLQSPRVLVGCQCTATGC